MQIHAVLIVMVWIADCLALPIVIKKALPLTGSAGGPLTFADFKDKLLIVSLALAEFRWPNSRWDA